MNALQQNEIMEKMDLNSITENKWPFYACVDIVGKGVAEGMKWLVETIYKNQET